MKKQNIYATMGIRALKRAAAKVAENTRKNNLKIPVWVNGKVEFIKPETPRKSKKKISSATRQRLKKVS